ncbi:MAG: Sensor histidine kinase [Myxococcaceae bacterium]|nr:Sensor histidine kinase [Myxococcaceae bacterium]
MPALPIDHPPVRFRKRVDWLEAAMRLPAPRRMHLVAFGLLVAIAICDYLAGIEVAFTLLLYLLPVCLVTWSLGSTVGLAFAALATACTALTAVGFADRTRPWFVAWDAAGTFCVLVTVVFVIDKLRAHVEGERRQRRVAVDQLRHADRLNVIGRLAAGMAHELGTPLSVIAGSAELLKTRRLTAEKQCALIDTIHAQTKRMSRIIRQLLDFGRAAGKSKAPVELNELAVATADLLSHVATERHCAVHVEPCESAITILANASEIEQVLTNLLLNGMQAMPDGGNVHLRTGVEPRAHESGGAASYAALVVEDEGIGISAEDLPHIFDPFFTTKEVGEGTGLGLAITYGIVQDHGGFVEVASRPHRGTSFKVLLPMADQRPTEKAS